MASSKENDDDNFVEPGSDEQISSETLSMLKSKINAVAGDHPMVAKALWAVKKMGLRSAFDHQYTALEDFQRSDPELKRIVFIGCTGAGKSTMGNIAAGWRLVGKMDDDGDFDFSWKHEEGKEPLFPEGASGESTTKKTAFANIHWLGKSARPCILVDTPGHDDTETADIESEEAREKIGELAADLHDKLKALGTVHAIVVIHNDAIGNKLNPATQTLLKLVSEKFRKADSSVWNNVIIAYSKCNEHSTDWRAGIAKKKRALSEAIKEKVKDCDVDLPIITLGGAELDPPAPSAPSATKGYEELWEHVQKFEPLDTSKLLPFEGSDVKWQKLIDDKNEAEAKALASLTHMKVIGVLIALNCFTFWRAIILPQFPMGSAFSMLLFNIPGTALDELLILTFVIHRLGPKHTYLSVQHFSRTLILPIVREPLQKGLTWSEATLRNAGVGPLADAAAAGLKALSESKPKKD